MAKTAAPERGAKSRAVRDFLKSKPNATVQEIQAGLKEQGVEVSDALISKFKSSGKTKKGRGRKSAKAVSEEAPPQTTEPAATAEKNGTTGRGSKAQAVRDAFTKLGKSARPKEIRAALAENNVTVSFAQITSVRKAMFRNGKKKVAAVQTPAPVAEAAVSAGSLTADDLLAAKKLVDQLGSVEAAQNAVQILVKLSMN